MHFWGFLGKGDAEPYSKQGSQPGMQKGDTRGLPELEAEFSGAF